jgi:3,4-dihydroxy 2-butanone 4-phosphate synthase/GTP cyclohydrolase II
VLVRAGHTEAACDLARMGGFEATGVICEVMNDDGSMARRPDLEKFAAEHGLKIGTIADLIHYRALNESTVEKLGETAVETDHGPFTLHTYRDRLNGELHFALGLGDLASDEPLLARVTLPVTVRDLLGIHAEGSTGWSVSRVLARIAAEGRGVLVLLASQETAADQLASLKIVQGIRPVPGATRGSDGHNAYLTIGIGSQILRDLGARRLRLMGAPIKYNAISGFDLEVTAFETLD